MAGKYDLTKLGRKVREFRKAEGMSVKDLARKVGCSYKHLFNIENGVVRPSIEVYVELVRALRAGEVPLLD